MDESAIRDEIGIKNSADRAKIIGSLVLLRAKAAAGPSEYNRNISAVFKSGSSWLRSIILRDKGPLCCDLPGFTQLYARAQVKTSIIN